MRLVISLLRSSRMIHHVECVGKRVRLRTVNVPLMSTVIGASSASMMGFGITSIPVDVDELPNRHYADKRITRSGSIDFALWRGVDSTALLIDQRTRPAYFSGCNRFPKVRSPHV